MRATRSTWMRLPPSHSVDLAASRYAEVEKQHGPLEACVLAFEWRGATPRGLVEQAKARGDVMANRLVSQGLWRLGLACAPGLCAVADRGGHGLAL